MMPMQTTLKTKAKTATARDGINAINNVVADANKKPAIAATGRPQIISTMPITTSTPSGRYFNEEWASVRLRALATNAARNTKPTAKAWNGRQGVGPAINEKKK